MAEVRKIFRTNDEQQQVDVYPITTIDAVLDENGESVRKLIAVSSQGGNALERKSDGLYVSNSGGGGGSSVSINQILKEGTAIADITIDGEKTSLYAPSGSGGGGGTTTDPTFTGSLSVNRKENTGLGYGSVAIGTAYQSTSPLPAEASGLGAIAIGGEASSTGMGSIAIGPRTTSGGSASVAIGYEAKANADNSTAIGYEAEGGQNSMTPGAMALGYYAKAYGPYSTAFSYATAKGQNSIAGGNGSKAQGQNSIALGYNNTVNRDYSFAIGGINTVSNTSPYGAGALGYNNTCNGAWGSIAIGYYNTCNGSYGSIAIGNNNEITSSAENGALASGYYTIANKNYQQVFGKYNIKDESSSESENKLFIIGNGSSANTRSNAFTLDWSGNANFAGTISSANAADYAEYFEWLDENIDNEDRVGFFVTLDGDKIKIAKSEDYILGIVSGNPFVLGNGDCSSWNKKYLKDDFNRTLREPKPKIEYIQEYDEENNPLPVKERIIEGEFEGTQPVLNPEFNPDEQYIPRKERQEWSPIGMIGVLRVRQDGTLKANLYAKVNDEGKATFTDNKNEGYKVTKIINNEVAEIILK